MLGLHGFKHIQNVLKTVCIVDIGQLTKMNTMAE